MSSVIALISKVMDQLATGGWTKRAMVSDDGACLVGGLFLSAGTFTKEELMRDYVEGLSELGSDPQDADVIAAIYYLSAACTLMGYPQRAFSPGRLQMDGPELENGFPSVFYRVDHQQRWITPLAQVISFNDHYATTRSTVNACISLARDLCELDHIKAVTPKVPAHVAG